MRIRKTKKEKAKIFEQILIAIAISAVSMLAGMILVEYIPIKVMIAVIAAVCLIFVGILIGKSSEKSEE